MSPSLSRVWLLAWFAAVLTLLSGSIGLEVSAELTINPAKFRRRNYPGTRQFSTVEQEVTQTVAFGPVDCARQCIRLRWCTAFELEDPASLTSAQPCYLLRSPHFSGKPNPPTDVYELEPERLGCSWNQNGGVQASAITCPDPDLDYICRIYCRDAWIILQTRGACVESFYKNWIDYKYGFGDPSVDLWIGNEVMSDLTQADQYSLRIEVQKADGTWAWSNYSDFSVAPEASFYMLSADGYTGSQGKDILNWDLKTINLKSSGANFSTPDQDNDASPNSCAGNMFSGFWYRKCTGALINTPCESQENYQCDSTLKACMLWYKFQWKAPPLNATWMLMTPRLP